MLRTSRAAMALMVQEHWHVFLLITLHSMATLALRGLG